jgi:UDP-N-acetylmuramate--alanine ligase
VEIRAVLSAARDSTAGRVIAVVQPHRFSRLAGLMEDFANAFIEADTVLVAPVYAAGEEPIPGVDGATLAEEIRARGHRMVQTVSDAVDLARTLRDLAADGDLVICMGAGDITKWAAGLEEAIRQERSCKVATVDGLA